MGLTTSHNIIEPINYNCPICMEEGRHNIPNIAGKFFIINANQCQCNGCHTIYSKHQFYKTIIKS